MQEFIINNSKGIKGIYKKLINIENNKINNDYSLTCRINNDEEYKIFISILSQYLIEKYFIKCAKRIMKHKKYPKETIDEFTEHDIVKNIKKTPYFVLNTEILLEEYFKNLNNINIEAFMIFNMIGFNDEVKFMINHSEDMSDKEYDCDDDLLDDDDDLLFDNEIYKTDGFQDTLSDIHKYLKDNGFNIEDFKELSIYTENKEVIIKDQQGEKYTKKNVINKIGIEMSYPEGDTLNEFMQDILFCTTFISIMGCKKVNIIKQDGKFIKTISSYLNMMGISVDIEVI
ncbi:TPA: hypothetical protein N2D99_002417 [Clostridium botulinum]|nr:hypothetical protein [Clostridium botulinum]